MTDVFRDLINPAAWVVGNLLVAYIAFAVLVFVIGYYIIYDPSATTAGRLIFRFFISLLGLIVLIFVGTYIDPAGDRSWLDMPVEVDAWRPLARVLVYGYIAFTITSLAVLLAIRKWWPSKIKTAPDLVKVRHETGKIPIV